MVKNLVYIRSHNGQESRTCMALMVSNYTSAPSEVEEEDEVVDTSKNNKIFKEKIVTHAVHAPLYPIVCVLLSGPVYFGWDLVAVLIPPLLEISPPKTHFYKGGKFSS